MKFIKKTKARRKWFKRHWYMAFIFIMVGIVLWASLFFYMYSLDEATSGVYTPLSENSLRKEVSKQNNQPLILTGNIKRGRGFIDIPRSYTLHKRLPTKRTEVAEAILKKHLLNQGKCWKTAHQLPLFSTPSGKVKELLQPMSDYRAELSLQKEYQFVRNTSVNSMDNETFYFGYDDLTGGLLENMTNPWWVSEGLQHLPCTSEVQQRLFEYQNSGKCKGRKFLLTLPRGRGFGMGSVLILVAFDLLSALILGRTLLIDSSAHSPWLFTPKGCQKAGRGYLDCFYLPPTRCKPSGNNSHVVYSVSHAMKSQSEVIRKKDISIPGLDRDSIPSDEVFFGPGHKNWACYPDYIKWVEDPANMVVQGRFKMGANTRLQFMLAQAFLYITRAPQPWLQGMLQYHLSPPNLFPSQKDKADSSSGGHCTIYIQHRGETAKMKEYYEAFGCHSVGILGYRDYVHIISTSADSSLLKKPCRVFISGGMPYKEFMWLSKKLEGDAHEVLSTWNLSTMFSGSESARWGASSPAASWVDMYAGVASTNWICVVQSNWCRVINFLRMTHGREHCGFIDFGALLLTSVDFREKYCFVADNLLRQ